MDFSTPLPLLFFFFFLSKHVNSIKQHFQRKFCFHKEKVFVVKYSVITFSEEKFSTFLLEILFYCKTQLSVLKEKKKDLFVRDSSVTKIANV